MGKQIAAIILLALLSALTQATEAAEEIRRFNVDIVVHPEGTLSVTETIHYAVGPRSDVWGIFNHYPLYITHPEGKQSPVTFQLQSVKRNGASVPHKVLWAKDRTQVILHVGAPDLFLPASSEQVYEVRYRTSGHLRRRESFDGLHWPVVRTWPFPVHAASVRISLPEGTPILMHDAFTGTLEAGGQNYEVSEVATALYRAKTTASLPPGDGFTIALTWPKGFAPVWFDFSFRSAERLMVFLPTAVGFLALFMSWYFLGRDEKEGPVRPAYTPPKGIAPAAMRYLFYRSFASDFDEGYVATAVLNMAVKGALRVVEKESANASSDGTFVLEPLGSADKGLTATEQAAYEAMFPDKTSLLLTKDIENGKRMDDARAVLKSRLRTEHLGKSFVWNSRESINGASAAIVTAAILWPLISENWDQVLGYWRQWLIACGAAAIVTFFATSFWFLPRILPPNRRDYLQFIGIAVPIGALVLAIAYWLVLRKQPEFQQSLDGLLLASGALFGVVLVVFAEIMWRPTKTGRRMLDRIKGFGLYLSSNGEQRTADPNEPQRTPAHFEQLLPYAVALDLTEQWTAKFAGVLEPSSKPKWYRGESFDPVTLVEQLRWAIVFTYESAPKTQNENSDARL